MQLRICTRRSGIHGPSLATVKIRHCQLPRSVTAKAATRARGRQAEHLVFSSSDAARTPPLRKVPLNERFLPRFPSRRFLPGCAIAALGLLSCSKQLTQAQIDCAEATREYNKATAGDDLISTGSSIARMTRECHSTPAQVSAMNDAVTAKQAELERRKEDAKRTEAKQSDDKAVRDFPERRKDILQAIASAQPKIAEGNLRDADDIISDAFTKLRSFRGTSIENTLEYVEAEIELQKKRDLIAKKRGVPAPTPPDDDKPSPVAAPAGEGGFRATVSSALQQFQGMIAGGRSKAHDGSPTCMAHFNPNLSAARPAIARVDAAAGNDPQFTGLASSVRTDAFNPLLACIHCSAGD